MGDARRRLTAAYSREAVVEGAYDRTPETAPMDRLPQGMSMPKAVLSSHVPYYYWANGRTSSRDMRHDRDNNRPLSEGKCSQSQDGPGACGQRHFPLREERRFMGRCQIRRR